MVISNNKNGFSALYILLGIITISLVIGSGNVVYSRQEDVSQENKNTQTNIEDNNNSDANTEQTDRGTQTDPEEVKYHIFENMNVRLHYPNAWKTYQHDDPESKYGTCFFSPEFTSLPREDLCQGAMPTAGSSFFSVEYGSTLNTTNITDVSSRPGDVYNGVKALANGTKIYDFSIRVESSSKVLDGRLVRIPFDEKLNTWIELVHVYPEGDTKYQSDFDEMLDSVELKSSINTKGIGG